MFLVRRPVLVKRGATFQGVATAKIKLLSRQQQHVVPSTETAVVVDAIVFIRSAGKGRLVGCQQDDGFGPR